MNRREFFAAMLGFLGWRSPSLPPVIFPHKPAQFPPERVYVGRSKGGYIVWDSRKT